MARPGYEGDVRRRLTDLRLPSVEHEIRTFKTTFARHLFAVCFMAVAAFVGVVLCIVGSWQVGLIVGGAGVCLGFVYLLFNMARGVKNMF